MKKSDGNFDQQLAQVKNVGQWWPDQIASKILVVSHRDRVILPHEIEDYRWIEYAGGYPQIASAGGYHLRTRSVLEIVEAVGDDGWDSSYIVCLPSDLPGEEIDLQLEHTFSVVAARRGWELLGLQGPKELPKKKWPGRWEPDWHKK